MSSSNQAPEPTMDDILASIRKIIAEDDTAAPAPAHNPGQPSHDPGAMSPQQTPPQQGLSGAPSPHGSAHQTHHDSYANNQQPGTDHLVSPPTAPVPPAEPVMGATTIPSQPPQMANEQPPTLPPTMMPRPEDADDQFDDGVFNLTEDFIAPVDSEQPTVFDSSTEGLHQQQEPSSVAGVATQNASFRPIAEDNTGLQAIEPESLTPAQPFHPNAGTNAHAEPAPQLQEQAPPSPSPITETTAFPANFGGGLAPEEASPDRAGEKAEKSVPEQTAPQQTTPDNAVYQHAAPENAASEQALPEPARPEPAELEQERGELRNQPEQFAQEQLEPKPIEPAPTVEDQPISLSEAEAAPEAEQITHSTNTEEQDTATAANGKAGEALAAPDPTEHHEATPDSNADVAINAPETVPEKTAQIETETEPPAPAIIPSASAAAEEATLPSSQNTPDHPGSDGVENSGLEASLRALIRPIVKEWLDTNMPRILQDIVHEELAQANKADTQIKKT